MKIEIKENAKLFKLEGKFDLGYLRKRTDYQKLLEELNSGKKLIQIFNSESIVHSIRTRMKNIHDETRESGNGLIDDNDTLTSLGLAKLKDPYFYEKESGTYALDIINLDDKWLITKVKRRLTNEEVKLEKVQISEVIHNNQFKLDDEQVFMFSFENSGVSTKSFAYSKDEIVDLTIDMINKTYAYKNVCFKLGDELVDKYNYELKCNTRTTKYGEFDVLKLKFLVDEKCIDNYTVEELLNRRMNEYNSPNNNIIISDCEFVITSQKAAEKYAYLYAFELLENPSSFYSFEELNDIYRNEILDSSIYSNDIKMKMENFGYTKKGFKNCDSKKYLKLEYKLKIQEWLLNVNMLETKEFQEAKNYKDIVNNFNMLVPNNIVEDVYVVMGYAFTKDSESMENRIVDFFSELSKIYNRIYILDKRQTWNNKISDDIRKKVTEDLNIKYVNAEKLKDTFHDRFIIFKLKDGYYKSYLVTCEIGQYFGNDTPRGSIFEYKEGVSRKVKLIDLVEKEIN